MHISKLNMEISRIIGGKSFLFLDYQNRSLTAGIRKVSSLRHLTHPNIFLTHQKFNTKFHMENCTRGVGGELLAFYHNSGTGYFHNEKVIGDIPQFCHQLSSTRHDEITTCLVIWVFSNLHPRRGITRVFTFGTCQYASN